ncbi:hypothetical protein B9Q01_06680 [Candidatus Marsarchaeota G1 archaeon OSP_D]|uniref:Uncharacterized protein n=2 Tax=Candidatus Marsarchaeota group 1 TaxID=2203770 RepID=A0A2R6A976_9ARCH|nr:MAG: hypothetical protein B9Q01_06680 [Candidatus Marsarchaeota G1 archaeon OSP_D]PSN88482.1 MAG: hypothetical protein B9Q00_05230 [Candidatus Marsarchaeota G1 archaeon OSP_C]
MKTKKALASYAYIVAPLNMLSGLVALFVSYYAYRYNKLVTHPVLSYVSMGFMLLGLGLLIEGSTSLVVLLRAHGYLLYARLSTFLYVILQVLSYLVIAIGYAKTTFQKIQLTAVFVLSARQRVLEILRQEFFLQLTGGLVSLVLLTLIVFQAILVYSHSKNRVSLYVLSGFCFVFLGQALTLASILASSALLYTLSSAAKFAGFVFMASLLSGGGSKSVGAERKILPQ